MVYEESETLQPQTNAIHTHTLKQVHSVDKIIININFNTIYIFRAPQYQAVLYLNEL